MLISLSCADHAGPERTAPPETQAVSEEINTPGKALFERHCSACHGTDGAAGIGGAADLPLSHLDTGEILSVIRNGRGAMPPFGNTFSDDEAAALVQYVMALRHP